MGDPNGTPAEVLRRKLATRRRKISIANEVVRSEFALFLQKRNNLDLAVQKAAPVALELANRQEHLEDTMDILQRTTAKMLTPIEERFHIRLPGRGLVQDAVLMLDRRVVPASCRVGASVPLSYVDPNHELGLADVFKAAS